MIDNNKISYTELLRQKESLSDELNLNKKQLENYSLDIQSALDMKKNKKNNVTSDVIIIIF